MRENAKCPLCGKRSFLYGEEYYCSYCNFDFNKSLFTMIEGEKIILYSNQAILTDKKIIVKGEIIQFKDIIEAYTSNALLPKVVLRLSDKSLREFSAGDTRSGLDKAASLLLFPLDFIVLNASKGNKVSSDRWVNLLNRILTSNPLS
jgi:hypothetical protein